VQLFLSLSFAVSEWTWFDVKGKAFSEDIWVGMSLCLPLGEQMLDVVLASSQSESQERLQEIADQLTITSRVLAESYLAGYRISQQ
jgi:hypothetical protein